MKILAIFSGYDKDNVIDDYVVYYLKELNKFADIIYVADNYMPKFELDKIKEYVIKAISYTHGEYDFGSYKIGYIYAKENNILNLYDYLVLCNDSNFGPLYSFDYIFKKFSYEENTVYGAFLYQKNKYHEEHLQSHFVMIPKSVFLSDWYSDFILSIKKQKDKWCIIKKYEIGMSILFKNHNINLVALHYFNENLPQFNPLKLIEQNYIFFKKSCYYLNIKKLHRILDIIKNNYDINLILNYYNRQSYYNCIFDRDTINSYKNRCEELTNRCEELTNRCEELKLKCGWFQLFNIYNNLDTLRIVIFGIKISIKMNTLKTSKFFIMINNFRNKFFDKFIGGGK